MSADAHVSPLLPVLPSGTHRRVRWGRLLAGARALAIARAVEQYPGPVMVVLPDPRAAVGLEDELRFYASEPDGHAPRHFPDWETLPYDNFSPHQDIVSERLATLYRLPQLEQGALIVPVNTLMVRLPPRAYLEANTLLLSVGDRLDRDAMRVRLDAGGYRCVGQVMEQGEYAARGSLLDLYPTGSPLPYRIDLMDDEVDSIRTFDVETQRSVEQVTEIRLLPAREFPLTEAAISRFRGAWRARFPGRPTQSPLYRDVSEGIAPAGIEYYLPLFFDQTETLFDYLPEGTLVIEDEAAHEAAERFWAELTERYEQRCHDVERPLLEPQDVFLPRDQVFAALRRFPSVTLGQFREEGGRGQHDFASRSPLRLPIDGRAADPIGPLRHFLSDFPGRALLVAETPGRREVLNETLQNGGLRPVPAPDWQAFLETDTALGITVAPLDQGAVIEEPPIAVIAESQLFGDRAMQRRRRQRRGVDAESIVRDLAELTLGAPVVHEAYGVGRYRGLETLTTGGLTGEFLTLEYAGGDRLYVPVASLHLITRYAGADPEHAPLHKLGTQQWAKARKKAAERVYDVAAELLDIQARREARSGRSFQIDALMQATFADGFPFEETPDQQAAIEQALADLAADRPMDRLVCGDVGFGKTEVAMRAAFAAVHAGHQVAILVPTTLLAQQHQQTFGDRFADWPVVVEQLSRFRTPKHREKVLASLASGKVDIVIGTHRLLGDGVRFKRLGLVIIDEEHRFGVRQKERLKALRAEVDVLTLTATPIPRTLNMALSGIRDLSLIGTPPERRLSIKTFVRQWNNALVREACLREIHRGGQVYFVHNRVEDIEQLADRVAKIVPEASLRVAHGQMRERELEQVMVDFYHQRFNLLVCTTIIESGIDVPSANTIIIHRADRFGLAQLHQLRGRVGRSHHRAYAYLLAPPRQAMTADAVKRLEAIESLEDLGIGFSLATHDLEIRGAGELLGEEQSGQIQEVGYALYTDLLERAVEALRAGRSPALDRPLDHGPEIDLHAPALIPADYLPDVHARLILYKRIASAATTDDLRALQVEMIDRFGLLPEPTKTLFQITELKLKAAALGIRKIDLGKRGGRIVFQPEPNVDPAQVVALIQGEPQHFRLDGPDKIRLSRELPELEARARHLHDLLGNLAVRDAA